jgi:hypothetical protein
MEFHLGRSNRRCGTAERAVLCAATILSGMNNCRIGVRTSFERVTMRAHANKDVDQKWSTVHGTKKT